MKKFIGLSLFILFSFSSLSSCGSKVASVAMNTETSEISTEVSLTQISETSVTLNETQNPEIETEISETTEITLETEAETEPETTAFDDMSFDNEIPSSYYIDAEVIYQNPELPTGCEITSLAMLLNYWGYNADKVDLSNNYLNKNYDYSCTFYDAFIGNPENDSGFGCYAPVIADAAYSYLRVMDSSLTAHNITGLTLDEIFHYIAMDRPVVIWASMSLVDVRYYHAWTTESGEEAWWYENEHCMLLTGYDYDNGTVTVCDPLKGEYTYDMYRFEEIFNTLEQQAVTIY